MRWGYQPGPEQGNLFSRHVNTVKNNAISRDYFWLLFRERHLRQAAVTDVERRGEERDSRSFPLTQPEDSFELDRPYAVGMGMNAIVVSVLMYKNGASVSLHLFKKK